MISVHGDDQGLVLPFEVAPVQIVVIPILYKGKEEAVMESCRKLAEKLKAFRVVLDEGEDRPGAKYYKWELKGVPIRFEIGPRDAEKGVAVASFRDEKRKFEVPLDEIDEKKVLEWAGELKQRLRMAAAEKMAEKVKFVKDPGEIEGWNGVVAVHLCSNVDCGQGLEEHGKSLLGWFEEIPDWLDLEPAGECVVCGSEGRLAALAKTY